MTPDMKSVPPKGDQSSSAAAASPERAVAGSSTTAQPRQSSAASATRMMWIGAGSIVALLLVIIIVFTLGLYKFGWDNSVTRGVVSSLHLPVAMYDYTPISYHDYQEDIDTLHFFYEAQQNENPGVVQLPTDGFLQKSVLSRMIRERFTADQAAAYGITVSSQELDDEYQNVVAQATNEQEVMDTLTRLYNWTPDQFKMKVLQPYILRNKLQEKIATDDSINAEAKTLAEEVLAKINSGTLSFEDAAKQYSEDTTASTGGDLGYFSQGQMVEEFETAAFALQAGEMSGLVKTQYGYHIINVTERVAATDDAPEQVRASHILIKTSDIDTWTNQQLADASISIFPKGLEWKDDCGLVLAKTETCDQNELLDVAAAQNTATTPDTTETDTNSDVTDETINTNEAQQ